MFPVGTYALGAVAGMLSTLSPCVLPLLPIVIGSAAVAHRFGAAALAGGVALSYAATGLFVASIGFDIGLDGDIFRAAAAILLLAFGLVLLSSSLQERFAMAGARIGNAASEALANFSPKGFRGQFVLGLLLGAVWSPCVGPTLGTTAILAAQRSRLLEVALTMVMFGLGAALPLLIIGSLSREAIARWRGSVVAAGYLGKLALGGAVLATAAAILSGFDRRLETLLVQLSPDWLTDFTTRF